MEGRRGEQRRDRVSTSYKNYTNLGSQFFSHKLILLLIITCTTLVQLRTNDHRKYVCRFIKVSACLSKLFIYSRRVFKFLFVFS